MKRMLKWFLMGYEENTLRARPGGGAKLTLAIRVDKLFSGGQGQ
jgi:hypothetical protein